MQRSFTPSNAWAMQPSSMKPSLRNLFMKKLTLERVVPTIFASAPSTGLPPNADAVLAALDAAPTLLLVGTLEPRKGQAQTLAAWAVFAVGFGFAFCRRRRLSSV